MSTYPGIRPAMVFGPYAKVDREEIAVILTASAVPFVRWEDLPLQHRQIEEWRNHLPAVQDLPLPFIPRFHFVELADEQLALLNGDLRKFGICPKSEKSQADVLTGLCSPLCNPFSSLFVIRL